MTFVRKYLVMFCMLALFCSMCFMNVSAAEERMSVDEASDFLGDSDFVDFSEQALYEALSQVDLGDAAPFSSDALLLRRAMAEQSRDAVSFGIAVAGANQRYWSTLHPITTGVHMGVRYVNGNWKGNGYTTIETKSTSNGTATERLRVPYTYAGTAVQTLVNWRYVDWVPDVSFSGVAPTASLDGELLDGETWQGSWVGRCRNLPVYERIGGTYHHTGSYNVNDTVMWAQGASTDANGWAELVYFDPLVHLYTMVDTDSSNKTLTASTSGVSDLSSWCDDADYHHIAHKITNAVCHDWTAALDNTTYTETDVDLGCVFSLGGSIKCGVAYANQYLHVTYVSHTGQTTNRVIQIPPAYRILYDSQGGSAVSSSAKIFTGYSRNVTSSVPTRDGYTFQGWYAAPNGTGQKYTAGTAITLTSDVTLYAHWKENPKYKITTFVQNGTITDSISNISAGATHTITYSPKSGYYLSSVTVDGSAVNINSYPNNYIFNNITANHTILVVYAPYYKITTEVENGSIDPDVNNIKSGETHTINYSPNDGYYLESVTVDGHTYTGTDVNVYATKFQFSNVNQNHTIKAVFKPYWHIETAIDYGTITPQINNIKAGERHSITWTPASGRYVSRVILSTWGLDASGMSAVALTPVVDAGDTYTFPSVNNNHRISVSTLPYYQITTSVSHGTITPKVTQIKVGEERTVSYAPDNGYYLKSVTVDGQAVDITAYPNSYTFRDISEDHNISVVYEPYWKIETEISGGTITPTDVTIKKGENRTVTWTPNDGWFVESVTIDGVAATESYLNSHRQGGEHVFLNIAENHKVSVVCKPMYSITTSITNGTITPTVTRILPGEERTIVYTPNEGYYVDSVTIDGVELGLSVLEQHLEQYVFSNIQANHTISVVCQPIPTVTITKNLMGESIWLKGSPQFQFVVSGTDRFGHIKSYHRTLTFTMDSGLTQSVALRVPNGSYTVSELVVNDWTLTDVSASESAVVASGGTQVQCTLDGCWSDKREAGATFVNQMTDWYDFTDNDTEVNQLH